MTSVYFDDVNFTSARDNLSGSPYRMTRRLIWYEDGDNFPNSIPVWEKTYLGRVAKERQLSSILLLKLFAMRL